MKILLGIFSNFFLYFFFALFNKTWDAMVFSKESVYWFGCLCFLCWFGIFLWDVLNPKETGPHYGDGI
jgi:hypothetical protein